MAPGGTLVVVGLHRLATVGDFAAAPVSLIADSAVGATRDLRRRAVRPRASEGQVAVSSHKDSGVHRYSDVPLRDPVTSLAEIRAAATETCPGARVRRRLYWRFTMLWRCPTPAEAVFPGRVQ